MGGILPGCGHCRELLLYATHLVLEYLIALSSAAALIGDRQAVMVVGMAQRHANTTQLRAVAACLARSVFPRWMCHLFTLMEMVIKGRLTEKSHHCTHCGCKYDTAQMRMVVCKSGLLIDIIVLRFILLLDRSLIARNSRAKLDRCLFAKRKSWM